MRRGLMAWSRDEVAGEVFGRRVAALGSALRERGLDCVLAYTDLSRPAAISALTHFIPYWSNGVLVVTPSGGATLVATVSRRVNDWVESTSRLDHLVNTLDLGAGVAEALPKDGRAPLRVGVVDLASLPSMVAAAIRERHAGAVLEEAGDLLAAVLHGDAGETDIIAQRCRTIAQLAVNAGIEAASARDAGKLLAAAEGAARRAGAEEIHLALAPDALSDARLRRVENQVALADVFMLQASVAYKGYWIRLGRTLAVAAAPSWIAEMDDWYQQLLRQIEAGAPARDAIESALARMPGSQLESWRLESAKAGLPLAVVDGSPPFAAKSILPAGPSSLTLRLRRRHTRWFAADPLDRRCYRA